MAVKVPAELAALAQPKDYNPATYHKIDWDAFASPAWRWERVLSLVDRTGAIGRVTRRDDDYIRLGKTFITQWRAGSEDDRQQLEVLLPGVVNAYRLFDCQDTDPNKRFCIEARILADQDAAQIAYEEKTEPVTIEVYEKLFYDVRGHLKRMDWILTSVLMPAIDRFAIVKPEDDDEGAMFRTNPVVESHFDSSLKFIAYYGGVLALEFAMTGFRRGVVPRKVDDLMEWYSDTWALNVARRSLQASQKFEINKFNVIDLFMTHGHLVQVQKSAEGQEEKRSTIEKHVNQMLGEIPWVMDKLGQDVYAQTPVGKYDKLAAELRDDEVMLLMAGDARQLQETLAEIEQLQMPTLMLPDKEVSNAGGNAHAD